MASKTTLNAKNLEALGAERLAELLIEISTGNANHKRKLRMELAGNSSSAELAREVRKRLGSIARGRSWIGWRKIKSFKADLENQRNTILEKIAPSDPEEGFELIWQFLSLADQIFERSDDGNGTLLESFHAANEDAGHIATLAKISNERLVEKIYHALQHNEYAQYERLIGSMSSALGESGLKKLQERLEESSRNGVAYRQQTYARSGSTTLKISLQKIADALNDVDLFIAQHPDHTHVNPRVATAIACRLLAAGRADEALQMLDKAQFSGRRDITPDWQATREKVLEALGRTEEAQQFRWVCFEQTLNVELLRAFLQKLPDFDDIEAEEKAFSFVGDYPDANKSILFFLQYPSLVEAAKLIILRSSELDGDNYELMSSAAERLADKHPLAAIILLRLMVDFTLNHSRTSRYKHAARNLLECISLDRNVTDYGNIAQHDVYIARLRKQHGKKQSFWNLIN
ncbi:hypothetical protein M8994_15805 [Brucella sp. 21LCYQ03]|nr:hypothetical protein [Brucella sp. 21LCYQ03]